MLDAPWDDLVSVGSRLVGWLPGGKPLSVRLESSLAPQVVRSFDNDNASEQTPPLSRGSVPVLGHRRSTARTTGRNPSCSPSTAGIIKPIASPGECHTAIARWRSQPGRTSALSGGPVRTLGMRDVARLRDGRLILITRPEGAVSWSSDRGHTWTEARSSSRPHGRPLAADPAGWPVVVRSPVVQRRRSRVCTQLPAGMSGRDLALPQARTTGSPSTPAFTATRAE